MPLSVLITGRQSLCFAPISARIPVALNGAYAPPLIKCVDLIAGLPGVTEIGMQTITTVTAAGKYSYGAQPAGVYQVCYYDGGFGYYPLPYNGNYLSIANHGWATCVWDGSYIQDIFPGAHYYIGEFNTGVPKNQRAIGVDYSDGTVYFNNPAFPQGGYVDPATNQNGQYDVTNLALAVATSKASGGLGVSFQHKGGEIKLSFEDWKYDDNINGSEIRGGGLNPTFKLFKIG